MNGSWVEITTPYLDRHNDALQIYARSENGAFVLTDDSYIIHDLEASGCKLDTEKRKDLLQMTLNGFGVKLNHEAIEVQATPENFPLRKHNLIQAMLAVNDLFGNYIVDSLGGNMCDTRTCGFCKSNHVRVRLTDGTFAHEFENPDHPNGAIAWCEPCADSTRYENQELLRLSHPRIILGS